MKGKMKAAQLMGYHRFEIVEVDIPQIRDNQVLVKVDKVGICGSDRGMWDNHHFFNELYSWEDFDLVKSVGRKGNIYWINSKYFSGE